MDQDMLGITFQRSNYSAQADDLRPGTDDGHNFHENSFRILQIIIPQVSGISGLNISSAQKSTIRSSGPMFSMEWVYPGGISTTRNSRPETGYSMTSPPRIWRNRIT